MTTTVAPLQPPPLGLLGVEAWRAAFEFLSHGWSRSSAQSPPSGDGHPVVIFPGLGMDASAVAPLRDHCLRAGYDAMDWGRGCNLGPTGDMDSWLDGLALHVAGLIAGSSQPATFIGWSLGGIYARELGKRMPGAVRQVISIGTPFNADADPTHAGWMLSMLGGQAPRFDAATSQRLRTPPPMPTTSIYSKSDGVVAWQACRHRGRHQQVRHVEVEGSHLGLAWNPQVLSAITQCLTAPGAATPGQP